MSRHAESFIIEDKRQRTSTFARARRNTNKEIIAVFDNFQDSTPSQLELNLCTFPYTLTGLRWSLSVAQDAGTGTAVFNWAIVIVPDGETADSMVRTTGATFYRPEKNCLVFGNGMIENNTETKDFTGTTKTMRKMMTGDSLVFTFAGITTQTTEVRGIIQFFQKM